MTTEEQLKHKLKLCITALRVYREADMNDPRTETSFLTTEESELVAKAIVEGEELIIGKKPEY